jgi:hypothetical protein
LVSTHLLQALRDLEVRRAPRSLSESEPELEHLPIELPGSSYTGEEPS